MRMLLMSLVAAMGLGLASEAHAQVPFYEPGQIAVTVGGGVEGFTDGSMNDAATTGGSWAARAVFGAHNVMALEAAYIGSAQPIDAFGIDSSALLVGHGAEGALRFSVFPVGLVNPYVFGGMAWRRYTLARTETNFSDVSDRDDVLEIPVGAGISWERHALILDARAQYRRALGNDLVSDGALHRWGVTANVGFTF